MSILDNEGHDPQGFGNTPSRIDAQDLADAKADALRLHREKMDLFEENLRLLAIINGATNALLVLCDGSNWPEYAQSGDGYKAYGEITEELHDLAADLQDVFTGGTRIEQRDGNTCRTRWGPARPTR